MPTIAKTDPVIVIIGPSGCGKSTVVRELHKRGLVSITPSWTDRPPRPDEEEIEHEFVEPTEFDRLTAAGFFMETVQPFKLPYRYGLPIIKSEVGRLPLVMLRVMFVPLLKKYYSNLLIYQLEAPYKFAEQAVLKRGGNPGTRLKEFEKELQAGRGIAKRRFINNTGRLDIVINEVAEAIRQDIPE